MANKIRGGAQILSSSDRIGGYMVPDQNGMGMEAASFVATPVQAPATKAEKLASDPQWNDLGVNSVSNYETSK